MKKIVSTILASAMALSLCACSSSQVDDLERRVSALEENTGITTQPTTQNSSDVATEETTITETTEHNPVLTLQQIEFNGVLPDGEYFVNISSFDDDCSGAMFSVSGYWRLSEEEYNNLEIGDTIIINETNYTWTENGIYNPERICYLENLANGYYYIWGDEDIIYKYGIVDNYHLSFAPNMEIWNDVCPYGKEQPFEPTIIDTTENVEHSFRYDNIQEFARDLAESNGCWGIDIIVENGVITKMYINPQCHQPWMSPEIWEKYHSQ